jgi:hypothetical protein
MAARGSFFFPGEPDPDAIEIHFNSKQFFLAPELDHRAHRSHFVSIEPPGNTEHRRDEHRSVVSDSVRYRLLEH